MAASTVRIARPRRGMGWIAGASPSSSTFRCETTGCKWSARHGKCAAVGKPSHAATCARAACQQLQSSIILPAPMIPWRGEAPRLARHGMADQWLGWLGTLDWLGWLGSAALGLARLCGSRRTARPVCVRAASVCEPPVCAPSVRLCAVRLCAVRLRAVVCAPYMCESSVCEPFASSQPFASCPSGPCASRPLASHPCASRPCASRPCARLPCASHPCANRPWLEWLANHS